MFGWPGKTLGGMFNKPPQMPAPPHWMPYVMVDNCDGAVQKVKALGGTQFVPPTDIEKVGRFAVFADPSGAVLAMIQMAPR